MDETLECCVPTDAEVLSSVTATMPAATQSVGQSSVLRMFSNFIGFLAMISPDTTEGRRISTTDDDFEHDIPPSVYSRSCETGSELA